MEMMAERVTEEKIALNVNEAAALIGVSPTTIYKMVENKEIPHTRVRSRIIFHRSVIDAWLRAGVPIAKQA